LHLGDNSRAAARGCFVKYLPPFEILKSYVTISAIDGELMVNCSYENLVQLIRRLIAGVEVDEKWYLARYEDIKEAIETGSVASARAHFVNDGYFEGRVPFGIKVDEKYYLSRTLFAKGRCSPASSTSMRTVTRKAAFRSRRDFAGPGAVTSIALRI
jgi:hypothetical protein